MHGRPTVIDQKGSHPPMTKHLRWIAAAGGILAFSLPSTAQAVQFSTPTVVPDLSSPQGFAWGDLNGDGKADLATASNDGVRVWLNTTPPASGSPTFQRIDVPFKMGGGRPQAIAIANIDADAQNRLDIVTANAAGAILAGGPSISVLRNVRNGVELAFARIDNDQPRSASNPDRPETFDTNTEGADRLSVVDLNDDRLPDILFANSATGRIAALRNITNSAPGDKPADRVDMAPAVDVQASGAATRPADLTAAEIDDTVSFHDVAVANAGGSVRIFLNTTSSSSVPLSFAPALPDVSSGLNELSGIAARDFGVSDRNRDDLVVSGGAGAGTPVENGGFSVLPNTTTSSAQVKFGPGKLFATGRHLTDVQIVNVDQTSGFDLVGSRKDGRATVALAGAATGHSFPQVTDHKGSTDATAVFVGELNGDTDPDVALLDVAGQRAVVALQSPDVRTSAGIVQYVEDQAPVAVDPQLTVFAPGGTLNLESATVRITSGAGPTDVLSVNPPAGISANYDAGARRLSLAGSAPVATYEQVLRSVTFAATGDNPLGGARKFAFTVSSRIASPDALKDGAVEAVNDAPVVLLSGPRVDPPTGPNPVRVDGLVDVADPDSGSLSRATVQIAQGYRAGVDGLLLRDAPGFDSRFDTQTGVLTITGNGSLSQWRDALRKVEFFTRDEGTSIRTFALRVTDSAGLEGPAAQRQFAPAPPPPGAGAGSGAAGGGAAASTLGARTSGSSSSRSNLPKRFSVRARALRDGRIRLTIKAPRGGRVAVSRVRVGRTTRLGARTLRLRRGGTRTMTLRPTRAAKRLLARRGKLAYRLRVTYRPTRGKAERKTLKVTTKKRSSRSRSNGKKRSAKRKASRSARSSSRSARSSRR